MSEYIAQHVETKFPDRLRLPLTFDPLLLARDLENLSAAAWVRHYVKQNYEGDWSVIPLRAPAGETHPLRMIYSDPARRDFVDNPAARCVLLFARGRRDLSGAAADPSADAPHRQLGDQGASRRRPQLRGRIGAPAYPGGQ